MKHIRKAMFAGSWYPGSAKACEKEIHRFIKKTNHRKNLSKSIIGGIVPHAGWYFSGSIACNVVRCLEEGKLPDIIVIFGMHLHAGSPNYLMVDGFWETPFGEIEIEENLSKQLAKRFSFEIETASHFSHDNTIELQLPFIKYFFGRVKIIPIGVPPTKDALKIGTAVAELAHNRDQTVKVLGSTDLTHYGLNYGFTPQGTASAAVDWVKNKNDRSAIDAMLDMDPESVINEARAHQNACCAGAAATAIASAKHLGANRAEVISYATSFDKNPSESFVGYVGIVFEDSHYEQSLDG